jgi:hypothetical protein
MHAIGISRRTALKYAAAATAVVGATSLPLVARARPARLGMIESGAGGWHTWFLARGSDLRLPPPPDSQAELAQTRGMLDSVDAAMRDRIVYWDAGAPPYRWNEIANDMFFRGAFGSGNFPRIQAYLNMALNDATVAAWDSKYTYNRPRPSELDPGIAPLVAVPGSPSYPSEHAVVGAAASEVLAYFAPNEAEMLHNLAAEASDSASSPRRHGCRTSASSGFRPRSPGTSCRSLAPSTSRWAFS